MAIIDYIKQLISGKNFVRFFLACIWTGFSMWFIHHITTQELPSTVREYVNTILGFLMGTIVGTITSYYFGSSQSSSDKDDIIKQKA